MTYPYGSSQYPDPNSGGYPHYPPGYPQPVRTNGLAIASMVLSIVGIVLLCLWGVGGIPALLGVIFGHVAKSQIRNDGTQGEGMATAGLVIGYIVVGLAALVILLFVGGLLSLFSLSHAGSI